MVDVFRPGGGIRIRAMAKPRKQIEFQMVVAIDQSGKDQAAVQIQLRSVSGGTSKRQKAAAANREIDALSRSGAKSYSGAGQSHVFGLMIWTSRFRPAHGKHRRNPPQFLERRIFPR